MIPSHIKEQLEGQLTAIINTQASKFTNHPEVFGDTVKTLKLISDVTAATLYHLLASMPIEGVQKWWIGQDAGKHRGSAVDLICDSDARYHTCQEEQPGSKFYVPPTVVLEAAPLLAKLSQAEAERDEMNERRETVQQTNKFQHGTIEELRRQLGDYAEKVKQLEQRIKELENGKN